MIWAFPQVLLLLAALLAQTRFAHGKLVIVEAGMFSAVRKPEIPLTPGKVVDFCPKTYSVKGFSIECRAPGIRAPVLFSVNGRPVRTENVAPYTLAGDYGTFRYPWTAYSVPGQMTVTCKAPGIHPHTAVVRFTCTPPQMKPTAPPVAYLPVIAVPRGFSPGHGCVVIKAGDYLGPLTPRWTREADGSLTYRKGDHYGGVEKAGTSPLMYSFKVPVKSQYAVTVDMTTRDYTEHNDIFLRFLFGGGFMLHKPGSLKYGGPGFLKAYHNKNRRATEAFSVDNNAHSFYTKAVLPPGLKLYITIGARSTKVTVHRIVLFPCEGDQCMAPSAYWQSMVRKCM